MMDDRSAALMAFCLAGFAAGCATSKDRPASAQGGEIDEGYPASEDDVGATGARIWRPGALEIEQEPCEPGSKVSDLLVETPQAEVGLTRPAPPLAGPVRPYSRYGCVVP